MWLQLLLVALAAYGVYRLFLGYRRPQERYRILASREVALVESAGEVLFPEEGAVPYSSHDARLAHWLDGYLALLAPAKRLQIRLLLLFFEQATVFFPAPSPLARRGWRRFSALEADQRLAVLEDWRTSRWFPRRLIFTALRAVLTLGYLGHPAVLRHLGLAPRAIESPIREADVLFPPVGVHPSEHPLRLTDVTAPSDGSPVEGAPLHPDYAEGVS